MLPRCSYRKFSARLGLLVFIGRHSLTDQIPQQPQLIIKLNELLAGEDAITRQASPHEAIVLQLSSLTDTDHSAFTALSFFLTLRRSFLFFAFPDTGTKTFNSMRSAFHHLLIVAYRYHTIQDINSSFHLLSLSQCLLSPTNLTPSTVQSRKQPSF